ncbi:C40 family peptidase [Bacillus sp. 31A1R]|uniref:C40 family peptidase n=1 Tax=Robertmurraya mangrovi TaxID=3098077 RepID=A0ABU5J0L3_9BACI|nr:C40 family peptidase [Bacillus sp. 31A1R]MDZ5472906.1 C40 family peptidase [Bacillus sp. 31A1R]
MFRKIIPFYLVTLVLIPLFFPSVSQASSSSCYNINQNSKTLINVPVANIWKDTSAKRTIDQNTLTKVVDMKSWTSKMSTTEFRKWLVGKLETQALYGSEVKVLKTSGSWVQVAVKDQGTPKNKYGYPGWMPKSQISKQKGDFTECNIASVKAKTANLYDDKRKKFLEVSFNTRLPVIKEEKAWVQVMIPSNKRKWMKKKDLHLYSSLANIPKPKGNDLVQTGKTFLGLPYLWAGISAYGFDCSGFTYSIYQYHGITIPRDAADQAKQGKFVYKSKLKPGDLLFFAYEKGKGRVHHVGMYVGNGKMIHSPNSGKNIEMVSIHISPFKEEYAGARRYIK